VQFGSDYEQKGDLDIKMCPTSKGTINEVARCVRELDRLTSDLMSPIIPMLYTLQIIDPRMTTPIREVSPMDTRETSWLKSTRGPTSVPITD
jgi:hypothetical protein